MDNRALIEKLNPLEYMEAIIALDVKDYSEYNRDAIIWAIMIGWEDEGYAELQKKFGWADEFVENLKRQHCNWEQIKNSL